MSCGKYVGPHPCCSVVQGDCLALAKDIPSSQVDLLLADPPYGIHLNTNYASRGLGRRNYPRIVGDDRPFDPAPWLRFPRVILFGANHYADKLPPQDCWIVWDKRCGVAKETTFADCELAWSNLPGQARVFRHVWNGLHRDSERGVVREHPTQKPVALMEWIIARWSKPGDVVLDPYLGSGTTAIAAKRLGRHFLGFEISPEYCEVSRRRLAAIDAQPTLFAPPAEQERMLF